MLIIAWLARLAFILYTPSAPRSFDATSWAVVAGVLAHGENPYQATSLLSWPPLWLQLIFLIAKMSAVLSLDFFHSLQLFLILVESAVIILTVRLVHLVAPTARTLILVIIGIALNPIAILQVCEHCNFDVIVALWLLLFMINLLRYNRTQDLTDWLCACLFLGLGILTKTVPLILVPLLAGGFHQANGRLKFLGAMLLMGPVTLGMSIIFVLSPTDIINKVLEYRSQGGFFGLSGLCHLAGIDEATHFCNIAFYILLFVAIAFSSILFWRRQSIGDRETVLWAGPFIGGNPRAGTGICPRIYLLVHAFSGGRVCFFQRKIPVHVDHLCRGCCRHLFR